VSVLSLVACVFALIIWLLSYFSFAPIGQYWTTSWGGNGDGWTGRGWIAGNGVIHLLRNDRTVTPAPTSAGAHYSHSGIDPIPGVQPQQTRHGFALVNKVSSWAGSGRLETETTQQLSFPGWLPPLLFALPPSVWLHGLVRRWRLQSGGYCLACSYNLTGNTSGVCPECGRPTTAG
jgi:hypothetical protein